MSLEAMEWVFEYSRARGVARMVLLAIAYRAPGKDCAAYAGTTMLVKRTGAARSSVLRAVDKLLDLGELTVLDGAKGPRGERCYQLPHAAAHLRGVPASPGSGGPMVGGPETLPVASSDHSSSDPTGSAMRPEGAGGATGGGSKIGPPNQIARDEEGDSSARASQPPTPAGVPDSVRGLVEALAEAGLSVAWRLSPGEWATVQAAEQRWGREVLVRTAIERTAGRDVRSARYLLAIWRDPANFTPTSQPPQPAGPGLGGNVVPLWRAPVSYDDNLAAGLELLERQEGAQ